MTAFQKSIKQTTNPTVRLRIQMEEAMADALVTTCLARGYVVSVNDGEEWVVVRSQDKAEIMEALFSTDEDLIMVRRLEDNSKVGWFSLIYGNDGWDVVSDYSANPVCDAIWETVIRPLSDQMEVGTWRPRA